MVKEELIIKLKERLRVYRDSPNVNATYVDLAHLIEDLLGMIESKRINGFNGKS